MRAILVTILATFALANAACSSPCVTATYWPTPFGYRVEFVVHADALRGLNEWGIETTVLTDLACPPNWNAGADFRKTGWYSPLPEYDLPPGGILLGCAASTEEVPQSWAYFVKQTGPGIVTFSGTVEPVPVPEPSACLALACGLVAIGGAMPRPRRRH